MNNEIEIWKDIKDYGGKYKISSDFNIRISIVKNIIYRNHYKKVIQEFLQKESI